MKFAKNWKTTLAGFIGAGIALANSLGITIPQEAVDFIQAAAIFALGFFAKDSNVTGA